MTTIAGVLNLRLMIRWLQNERCFFVLYIHCCAHLSEKSVVKLADNCRNARDGSHGPHVDQQWVLVVVTFWELVALLTQAGVTVPIFTPTLNHALKDQRVAVCTFSLYSLTVVPLLWVLCTTLWIQFKCACAYYCGCTQNCVQYTGAKRIRETADQLDCLTQKVVEAALEARRDPSNKERQQQLNELRRQWAEKVQELTKAIDEIISASDFATTSGN